ncbi:unnamed protein product [Zymoseptoria tritici ST99CH_1E4]|uniref:Rho-GAP domain-containing protein n=1 Tax=Zymoseptoria tritici ST99CH_1E4 TaxID=1276532 RepID=A0A2H1H4Q7_ZYMTR|nr:unnamed protein product [Zymoseptoria tritici ST99CH_1E4]
MSSHVNSMRSALAAATRSSRARSNSLSTIPPATDDDDYLPELAAIAASILYRSPQPSPEGRPLYILNAAAFPDSYEVDYDTLLSYVLARLPDEEELISGTEYEIIFFAGGQPDNASSEKRSGPPTGWYLQAYHVLSRATRKKLQRLYIVHPRTWVRVLIGIFGTIVSPKVRRKIIHASTLSSLAEHIPIEQLLIPPSVYLHDRKLETEIHCATSGRRAFGVRHPLPKNLDTGATRLPRILRETTSFLMLPANTKMEGLFRIPPHSVLQGVLKEAYDRGQHYIVWKEGGATLCQPGIDPGLVDEVRLEDAYGVSLAASLVKLWYRELRDPIFAESSYPLLRERYGDPTKDITPEDLVDLILPASQNSPLTVTSREILTRHLLPLLSVVASQSASNKMTSENLAILFSMCLVCGSNQLEDGRFSTTAKRILHAAIDVWPELRTGMGLDHTAFLRDVLPPPDARDYEDPLESPWMGRNLSNEKDEGGHRISMAESEGASSSVSNDEKPPALPPRRSRASSIKAALAPHFQNTEKPSLPRRKPAPQPAQHSSLPHYSDQGAPSSIPADPSRYSTVFDANGNSLRDVDLSTTLGPADGFAPVRTIPTDPSHRKTPPLQPSYPFASSNEYEAGKTNSIKRKPVSRQASGKDGEERQAESNDVEEARPSPTSTPQHFSETNANLARLAAARGASRDSTTLDTSPPSLSPIVLSTSPIDLSRSSSTADRIPSPSRSPSDQHVFPKPTVPASHYSLAKPVLAPQRSATLPGLSMPPPSPSSLSPSPSTASAEGDGRRLSASIPKVRAPSPGLLKRMASMEQAETSSSTLGGKVGGAVGGSLAVGDAGEKGLRKSSVDDLRRIYEERAGVAQVLVGMGAKGK